MQKSGLIGWRRGLELLRHASRDKSDFGGVRFEHTVFTSALKSIDTFSKDRCITLKDRPAC